MQRQFSSIEINQILASSEDQLVELLQFQNDNKQTFLHTVPFKSLDSVTTNRIITVLSKPKIKAVINQIATLQDNSGSTIYHLTHTSMALFYDFLIDCLDDKTFDALLQIRDFNGASVLKPIITTCSIASIKLIHQKALLMQTVLKTHNYFQAIIDLITSSPRSTIMEDTISIEKLECLLDIANESLATKNFPAKILYDNNSKSESTVISIFSYLARSPAFNKELDQMRGIIIQLLEKIPPHIFIANFEEIKSNKFLNLFLTNKVLSSINDLFFWASVFPYVKAEPLKIYQIFSSIYSLNIFSQAPRLTKYEEFLINPEQAVLRFPQSFCLFYRDVVHYQLSLGQNINQDYIRNIYEALLVLSANNQLSSSAYDRLKHMYILLNGVLSTPQKQDLLTLRDFDYLDDTELQQSSDLIGVALKGKITNDLEKALLSLKMIRLGYAATKKIIQKCPLAAIDVLEEKDANGKEEKKDNEYTVVGLDEPIADIQLANEQQRIFSHEATNAITLLNTRIYNVVGLDQTIKLSVIDEVQYQEALRITESTISEGIKSQWIKDLQDLNHYMVYRKNVTPFFFMNSSTDYYLRKEYFDRIVGKNTNIEDVLRKAKTIQAALKDPRLRSTYGTNRFLDIMQRMSINYEAWITLMNDSPHHQNEILHEMNFDAGSNMLDIALNSFARVIPDTDSTNLRLRAS